MPAIPKPPISTAAAIFGGRVREQRTARGFSQEQLAAAAGLHWIFIGQVERGRRNLALHNILRIAHGLQVDPGELLANIDPPEPADQSPTGSL